MRGLSFPPLARLEERIASYETVSFGADLRKSLRAAHMPVTLENYLHSIHLNLAASLAIYCVLVIFFSVSGFTLNLGPFTTSEPIF